MSQHTPGNAPSKYYHFAHCNGLEALSARQHKTAFPAHFHPTFNITLVYEGVFMTKLHDRLLIAPPGSILITNPGEIHANPFTRDSQVSFFTFYVSHDFVEYCNQGRPVYFEQKVIDDANLFAAMHQVSLKLSTAAQQAFPEDELRLAFAALAAQYGAERERETSSEAIIFEQLLNSDRLEKFSLADEARNMGIDKYKFLRLFKQQTGLTPNNYFIYRRIEKSKALLTEGRDLLSIAIDLGFYDAAHYANHFKKFTGVSPISFTAGRG